MDFTETVALGAIAGLTIFIGLPLGRIRGIDDRTRVCLAMFSVGILAFIFMDVTKHAEQILETSLDDLKAHRIGLAHMVGNVDDELVDLLKSHPNVYFTLALGGLRRQLYAPWLNPPHHLISETVSPPWKGRSLTWAAIGGRTAEGLAIGVSAKAGAIGLATVLIIGFGLHNATEGFGIVGPLGGARPSWSWLACAGLIGGAPTFLGTVVGYQVASSPLELLFYSLAGGAILYVIGEIWTGMRRYGHHTLGLYLIAAGFLVGVATDLIVSYGGG